MSGYFLSFIKGSIRHWYISLIVGILFVLLGIITLLNPMISLFTIGILFSLSFMVGGIIEVIFSIENRFLLYNWGWKLVVGILTFFIGLLLFLKPEITIEVISLYVGFLIMFRSFSAVSFALDFKRYGNRGWIYLLIFGISGVVFSFFLLWNPVWVAIYIAAFIGISLFIAGFFNVYYGFKLRKIKKVAERLSPEMQDKISQLKQEIRKRHND